MNCIKKDNWIPKRFGMHGMCVFTYSHFRFSRFAKILTGIDVLAFLVKIL